MLTAWVAGHGKTALEDGTVGMSNPLALQLYTVRQELAADRAGVLRRLAGFGYGAVEPFDVISDPDGLRADLDAAGLAVLQRARPPVRGAGGRRVPRHPGGRRGHGDRPAHAARSGSPTPTASARRRGS